MRTQADQQLSDNPGDPGDPAVSVADDPVTLPWWRSATNLATIAVAIAVLGAAFGYVVGNNRALPDPNSTDVGFLQDMRVHHEQAVQLSLIYLDTTGTEPSLATTAREIVVGQNIEIGRMIQLLRDFGESEVNETDIAMAWMGAPVALDRMPGLATADDLVALRTATGADADAIFVRLMTAHHQGGIHMADDAATHASTKEVATMAEQMANGQRGEIADMARLLELSTR